MLSGTHVDAVTLLKADHRNVENLFEQFGAAKSATEKRSLVKKISTELITHTIIEEEIFYPACKGKIDGRLLNESYVEHDGAKVIIAELLESVPSQEFYDAKVKVLSEQIKHHVQEEERRLEGMFSQARAAGVDMVKLGDLMKARKQALHADFKKNGLPTPTTRTFTGHTLEQGSPVTERSTGRI